MLNDAKSPFDCNAQIHYKACVDMIIVHEKGEKTVDILNVIQCV